MPSAVKGWRLSAMRRQWRNRAKLRTCALRVFGKACPLSRPRLVRAPGQDTTEPKRPLTNALRKPATAPVGRPPNPKPPAMGLSKRVKASIELMIFEGLSRKDAARKSGLADNSLYVALRNPEVLRYFNAQMDVLRTGARPQAFHQIATLSESAKSEKVKLDAAKYLESEGKAGSGPVINLGINIAPGYLIDLHAYDQGELTQIEHQALIGRKQLK